MEFLLSVGIFACMLFPYDDPYSYQYSIDDLMNCRIENIDPRGGPMINSNINLIQKLMRHHAKNNAYKIERIYICPGRLRNCIQFKRMCSKFENCSLDIDRAASIFSIPTNKENRYTMFFTKHDGKISVCDILHELAHFFQIEWSNGRDLGDGHGEAFVREFNLLKHRYGIEKNYRACTH